VAIPCTYWNTAPNSTCFHLARSKGSCKAWGRDRVAGSQGARWMVQEQCLSWVGNVIQAHLYYKLRLNPSPTLLEEAAQRGHPLTAGRLEVGTGRHARRTKESWEKRSTHARSGARGVRACHPGAGRRILSSNWDRKYRQPRLVGLLRSPSLIDYLRTALAGRGSLPKQRPTHNRAF
jgi:hypothetical protein